MRVPGFEPEYEAWQAPVIPGYTTPAFFVLAKLQLRGYKILAYNSYR